MRYIMVTGSRHAKFHYYHDIIYEHLSNESDGKEWTLVHGNARGVDKIAASIGRVMGLDDNHIIPFPADWGRYGYGAGPIRNEEMTRLLENKAHNGYPVLCLAFHHDWGNASGTNNAIEYAESSGIPVTKVTVDQPV